MNVLRLPLVRISAFVLIFAMVFTLGASAEAPAASAKDFERALERARKQLSKKKYEKAIPYFVQANALAGGSCQDCLQGLGIAARRSSNPELALNAYEQLLELGGDNAFDALQRAVTLTIRLGTPFRGIAACRAFLQTEGKSDRQASWALNEIGLLLAATGDEQHLVEASSALYAAVERNQKSSGILRVNVAEVEWRLGRDETALDLLQDLSFEPLKLSPNFRQIELTMDEDPAIERLLFENEQHQSERRTGWTVQVPAGKRWRAIADLESVDAVFTHLMEEVGAQAPIQDRLVACGTNVDPGELNARLLQAGWPGPFLGSAAVTRPEIVHHERPQFNEEARKARIQGQLQLLIVIDDDGGVSHARALSTLPMGLKEDGLETVRRWRYRPATWKGKAISVCQNVAINFWLG